MTQQVAPRSTRDVLVSAVVFLAVALALRLQFLGSPVQHIDEQFYLMVADRMAQGAWPYVDIWDRKPPGLFLIYRAGMALPGNPVVGVQLLGLLAAVGTALTIERIAQMLASPRGARLAGVAYLGFMPVFGCGYAQSPVFFNLPVAIAALWTIQLVRSPAGGPFIARGCAIMALLGVAMQIKYTALFEGVALGLMLLWHGWRCGVPLARLTAAAALWVVLALAPTAAAVAVYILAGHGEAFMQANFLSIFNKTMGDGRELIRIGQAALILSPFAVGAFFGPAGTDKSAHRLARLWGLAAIAGYAVVGHWYDHYVGPMLVPLAVLAAPMLGAVRWYGGLVFAVAAVTNLVVGIDRYLNDGTPAQAEQAAARISEELRGGCLYQYQGQTVLYRLTGACIPTRFPFPDHLATAPEAPALGVDAAAEARAIMARRPAVVLVDEAERPYMQNAVTRGIVDQALAQHYVRLGQIVIGRHHFGFWRVRR